MNFAASILYVMQLFNFLFFLFTHSLLRWLVLGSLVYTLYRAYMGYRQKRTFTATDNAARHWTATIAHIQLVMGILLYIKSPLTTYFRKHTGAALHQMEFAFFGLIHALLMFAAIIVITLGSALAKRSNTDEDKFRTLLRWYVAALIIISLAIPWPFSPLAQRPLIR